MKKISKKREQIPPIHKSGKFFSVPKYSIVVPAFNEEKILEKNIEKLYYFLFTNYKKSEFEIIIGDDGSIDYTYLISKKLSEIFNNVSVIKNEENTGRGSILTKAFINAKGKIVAYVDADLAIDISLLPKLIDCIENGFDIATGSKHLKNSNIQYSFLRKILSDSYSTIAKLILNCPIHDYQCGMKAFNKNSFMKILPYIHENGWAWDTEVLALAYYNKMKIKELPAAVVNIKDRKSKVIFRDIYRMFNSLLRIRKNSFMIKKKD